MAEQRLQETMTKEAVAIIADENQQQHLLIVTRYKLAVAPYAHPLNKCVVLDAVRGLKIQLYTLDLDHT
jgi:hypothetical protein